MQSLPESRRFLRPSAQADGSDASDAFDSCGKPNLASSSNALGKAEDRRDALLRRLLQGSNLVPLGDEALSNSTGARSTPESSMLTPPGAGLASHASQASMLTSSAQACTRPARVEVMASHGGQGPRVVGEQSAQRLRYTSGRTRMPAAVSSGVTSAAHMMTTGGPRSAPLSNEQQLQELDRMLAAALGTVETQKQAQETQCILEVPRNPRGATQQSSSLYQGASSYTGGFSYNPPQPSGVDSGRADSTAREEAFLLQLLRAEVGLSQETAVELPRGGLQRGPIAGSSSAPAFPGSFQAQRDLELELLSHLSTVHQNSATAPSLSLNSESLATVLARQESATGNNFGKSPDAVGRIRSTHQSLLEQMSLPQKKRRIALSLSAPLPHTVGTTEGNQGSPEVDVQDQGEGGQQGVIRNEEENSFVSERKERRKASNREAARRMRKRHADRVAELQAEVDEVREKHVETLDRLAESRDKVKRLEKTNRRLEELNKQLMETNKRLQDNRRCTAESVEGEESGVRPRGDTIQEEEDKGAGTCQEFAGDRWQAAQGSLSNLQNPHMAEGGEFELCADDCDFAILDSDTL